MRVWSHNPLNVGVVLINQALGKTGSFTADVPLLLLR